MDEVPDYVWDILQAWLYQRPLNFGYHEVPIEVQGYLKNAVEANVLGTVKEEELSAYTESK